MAKTEGVYQTENNSTDVVSFKVCDVVTEVPFLCEISSATIGGEGPMAVIKNDMCK